MAVGEKIKKYRKQKGMTQKQLSLLVDLADVRIRQYEVGIRNPKKEMLVKIADALSVPVEALVERNLKTKEDAVFCLNEIAERFGENIILEYSKLLSEKVNCDSAIVEKFYSEEMDANGN